MSERIYAVHKGWGNKATFRVYFIEGERKPRTFKFKLLPGRNSAGFAFHCRVQLDLEKCHFTPEAAIAAAILDADGEVMRLEDELADARARRQALDMIDPTDVGESGKDD